MSSVACCILFRQTAFICFSFISNWGTFHCVYSMRAKCPYLIPSWVGHKQCAMLFRRFVSRTAAGCGRAVLEGVGLSHETIQMCYNKSSQNEEEAIQSGLLKWRDGKGDSPTWEVLIETMEYAEIGLQHIKEMKRELFKGTVCQLIGQACPPTICVVGFPKRHMCPLCMGVNS